MCNPGFDGDHCETNINECEGVDCGAGTCQDGDNSYSV
eukprot:UN26843